MKCCPNCGYVLQRTLQLNVVQCDQATRRAALTRTQERYIAAVFEGLSNAEIAERYDITVSGLKAMLHLTYQKLGVSGRAELIAHAAIFGGFHLWTYDPSRPAVKRKRFETAYEVYRALTEQGRNHDRPKI
ncbi:MAG: helix-turn-helix transcriptional regulator [Patescibacteria group bacterium]|nr:helix-turn-helix transcriptional regulator [Patescibacteria group bacterium]